MPFNRKAYELESGRLGSYVLPGSYPLYYITAEGVLCPDCANSISECPDDRQWLIVAADINYEDINCYCAHCNKSIDPAYLDGEELEQARLLDRSQDS